MRVKFRLWPGQRSVLEGPIKSGTAHAMRGIDASFADWMISVHYRSEPRDDEVHKRLPRPAALNARRPVDESRSGEG